MITDPRVIKYVNETLRPLAERTRAVQAEIETSLAAYAVEVQAVVEAADAGAPLEDGRDAEGVSRLTREDIMQAVGLLDGLAQTARLPDNAQALAAMHKACVRPLRITSVPGGGG